MVSRITQLNLKNTFVPFKSGIFLGANRPNYQTSSSISAAEHPRLLGPAVSHHLKKYGLTSSQINGSGPHGTVSKGDVLKYVSSNKITAVSQEVNLEPATSIIAVSKPVTLAKKGRKSTPASYVEVEISNMRRTIAKRLLQSKSTIPHAYAVAECNVKNLITMRKILIAENMKVSVNDFIIKCVANALIRVPSVNCVWEGDKLINKSRVDISVAVATPNGLITPIVFDVIDKDVLQISETVKLLAAKAKDGKLQPNEFMGGTFSISNLGMFGVHSFSAIINPPQCAILAIGGNILSIDENGKPSTTSHLQLSYDARAISETDAMKFLANLCHEIESVSETSLGIYDIKSRKEML